MLVCKRNLKNRNDVFTILLLSVFTLVSLIKYE